MTSTSSRPWLAASLALLVAAPVPAQVFTKVGQGGGVSTRVGQNRSGVNPTMANVGRQLQQALQPVTQQLQAAMPASALGGSSGSVTRVTSGGPQYPWVDGYQPPPEPTWRERVAAAKEELDPEDRRGLARALGSDDPAEVFAVLSLEADGKLRFKEEVLAKVLETTRDRAVARAAVVLLGKRRTPSAYRALSEHVSSRGRADDSAIKVLWAAGPPWGKDVFYQRASQARSRDTASLLAIRALALFEGAAVTQLLERLSTDWAPTVQEAAEKALEMRAQAGLPTSTRIKPVPYGDSMEKVLKRAPKVDWGTVYRPPQTSAPEAEAEAEGAEW